MEINNQRENQGTQLDQMNWFSVGQGPSTLTAAEIGTSERDTRLGYANCSNTANVGGNFGIESCCIDTYRDWSFVNRTGLNYVPCASGLGLEDPASSVSRSEGFLHSSNTLIGCHYTNRPQYEFVIPHRPVYDLNYLPGEMSDSFSSEAFQFALETPYKILSTMGETTNVRSDQQENLRAATGVDTNVLHYDKELQIPVTESSSAAVTTAIIENLNPEKGDSLVMETNKTPNHKPKRKKHRPKVVIEEKTKWTPGTVASDTHSGETPTKRKNTGKTTEKKAPNGDSTDPTATPPRGKRKNAQQNTIPNSATTCQVEAFGETGESETLELAKKSCRRTLNFDMEEFRTENSKSRSISDPRLEPQLENVPGGNKSKSATYPGQEVQVMGNTIQAGIAYKFSDYVHQMPKENTPLPEREAPRAPVPAKSNPQYGEPNANLHNSTQGSRVMAMEAGNACDFFHSVNQTLKKYISLLEREALTMPGPTKSNLTCEEQNHNIQRSSQGNGVMNELGKAIVNELPVEGSSSQASTNCRDLSEQRQGSSTMKHCISFELPDSSSTNATAVHCNNLAAYQIGSVTHFPTICKKKRTEKRHTTLSAVSSSETAAKDSTMRIDLTSQGWNFRRDASTTEAKCWSSAQPNTNEFLGSSGLQCNLQSNNSNLVQTERSTQKRPVAHFRVQNTSSLSEILWGPTYSTLTERSTKKRSRAHVRVRNLASLSEILWGPTHPTVKGRQGSSDHVVHSNSLRHHAMEALVAEMHSTWTTKKRTKKRTSLINSTSSSTTEDQSHGRITLYSRNKLPSVAIGETPQLIQNQMFSVDLITEHFQYLDINRENRGIISGEENALIPYSLGSQNESTLALYRKDDAIVPFKAIRKRRPLPKVDLDDETNRVWKLLLENINSEGIDGTDDEKVKWWEEERKVFSGRANSFIARMRLVQGDRRFSPWKGSVVDSVIGVFLTQNVSDHLSSSAFMSLAARFPLKSNGKFKPWCEERSTSFIDKQIVHILDTEDLTSSSKEATSQSTCNQSTIRLHEIELDDEREVVNSNESSGSNSGNVTSGSSLQCNKALVDRSTIDASIIGKACYLEEDTRTTENLLSSQTSVMSFQIPFASPPLETVKRKEPFKENFLETYDTTGGSELNYLSSPTSFVDLLWNAGSPIIHEDTSQGKNSMPADTNGYNKRESIESNFQRQKVQNLDGSQSIIGESVTTSNNYCFGPTTMSRAPEAECLKMTINGREHPEIFKNCHQTSLNCQRCFTEESASQIMEQTMLVMGVQEVSRSTMAYQLTQNTQEDENISVVSHSRTFEDHKCGRTGLQAPNNEIDRNLKLVNISKTLDITESTNNKQGENPLNITVSESTEIVRGENKDSDGMNAAMRKAKSRRVGNEIKGNVDWDELRKQAEANGRKRERRENTMDSLDWEAIRCADVNEIAKTIRARGMNNMLAERIKDFLNRLVREHGRIDLEWLRDIPPDKAKEYLLSIRGLGLKSVECVRLLTLHHVAFPVDTNVGRIAVRLGWVPLQPLPESLQLHLLELYPVLESIQKYLWPRLCKLDQRTLYELHYQLITFGKVFCTKSKPNCNSCPLRGECRHFASAFASARLALPGPEEKSIVSATQNKTNSVPTALVDQLPLPLPQATVQSEVTQWSQNLQTEALHKVSNREPIIEEPASPEPECKVVEKDIEDFFSDDPDEIPVIKLNIEEFTQNLQNYMQENMELQEGDMSKALVALTEQAASIPAPRLKNVSQLRTEHQVYELPDSHPLLAELDRREPDDPCSYLLAIWSPGETANSIKPHESCGSQETGILCENKTCFSCNSIKEASSQIVRGTILIPCRTAMRGSFPLNGTYFQVNEVFADHDSSLNPIDVPRAWIWNLPRRTVYFGTSIPSIFKGLTAEIIQQCFWRGYVCVRGFDRKTRAPRPLKARLHYPASKLTKNRGIGAED